MRFEITPGDGARLLRRRRFVELDDGPAVEVDRVERAEHRGEVHPAAAELDEMIRRVEILDVQEEQAIRVLPNRFRRITARLPVRPPRRFIRSDCSRGGSGGGPASSNLRSRVWAAR